MSHQGDRVTEIISNSDEDDDRRLYECARKYEIIVKQFDELVGLLNNGSSIPKRRKIRRQNFSGEKEVFPSSQANNNEALVKTVTRFLHELKANPTDSECSKRT